jgi:LppP/LprE lipoprotein
MTGRLLALPALMLAASLAHSQTQPASWLDRPLANWNKPGANVPVAPRDLNPDESREELVKRCMPKAPRSTAAERALAAAGWIAFWNFDQQLVSGDVEIVGGMADADGMCRPSTYNIFVFVAGRFAGVLSPTDMTSRFDGSSGVVRMQPPAITAEFARYTSTDPLCCPSSHVRVNYRIDRGTAGPVVVPTDVAKRP